MSEAELARAFKIYHEFHWAWRRGGPTRWWAVTNPEFPRSAVLMWNRFLDGWFLDGSGYLAASVIVTFDRLRGEMERGASKELACHRFKAAIRRTRTLLALNSVAEHNGLTDLAWEIGA